MSVQSRGSPDRRLIVLSDIEMGAGGAVDDFPHSEWLGERLRRFADEEPDLHLDLVFNGDVFDLLKTSYRGAWPTHVTAEIAVGKMARVADAHAAFFAALRDVLARRGGGATLHFVAGNHDLELLYPEVQALLRHLVTADERLRFHGHGFDLGRVRIEHGSQLDPLFRVEPNVPFLEHDGVRVLNLSWASVALLELVIPLQERLGHHDRLKPKRALLDVLPELREYLSSLAWGYWTRDFWRDFFTGNSPVKRVSWTMLKEIVWRTVALDVEVSMEQDFHRQCQESDRYQAYVLGHQHESAWWSFGDRKVLRTGCLRDEYMLSDGGRVLTPINKSWAELWLCGDRVVRSHLVEEVGPPRAPEAMPATIFDVVPWIREQLGSPQARVAASDEQAAEEARDLAARER